MELCSTLQLIALISDDEIAKHVTSPYAWTCMASYVL